MHELADKAKSG
jgi:2-oxoglutarate dehydrogenase E2 component (dihydrolipoamide succinyltransferase)